MPGRWWAKRPSEIRSEIRAALAPRIGSGPSPAQPFPLSDLTTDDIQPTEPFTFALKYLERECGIIEIEDPGGPTVQLVTARLILTGNVANSSDPVTVIMAVPGRHLPDVIQFLVRAYAHWAENHSGEDGIVDSEGAEVGD